MDPPQSGFVQRALDEENELLSDYADETEHVIRDVGDKWGELGEKIISGVEVTTESVSSTFGDMVGDMIAYNADWEDSWDTLWKNSVKIFASALGEMAIKAAASGVWDLFKGGFDSSGTDLFNDEGEGYGETGVVSNVVSKIPVVGGALSKVTGFFGFADGGYTGPGGQNEPAGIVHRDEFVFSKEQVDSIGLGTLNSLAAMPGYAAGGHVGSSAVLPPWLNGRDDDATEKNTEKVERNTEEIERDIDALSGTVVANDGNTAANKSNTSATKSNTAATHSLSKAFGQMSLRDWGGVVTKTLTALAVAGPVVAVGMAGKAIKDEIAESRKELDLLDDIADWSGRTSGWGESDTGSGSGVGDTGGGTPDRDPGGSFGMSTGGIIDRVIIPNGDDGLAGYKIGEGVVNLRGMAALARINDGGIGGGNEEVVRYLRKIIALLSKEKAALIVDGQEFNGWLKRATSDILANRSKQNATGRTYVS